MRLRAAEHSKHILVLLGVLDRAVRSQPAVYADLEMSAAWKLLATVQGHSPEIVADIITMPHVGAWAIDCLLKLQDAEHNDPATFVILSQFCAISATAGLRAGFDFDLPVALQNGSLALPGCGIYSTPFHSGRARLISHAGRRILASEGLEFTLPLPWPKPWRLRFSHAGLDLDILVDSTDSYLDRYSNPVLTDYSSSLATDWSISLAASWRILAEHHSAAAREISSALRVIVPLRPERSTYTVSATSKAAFGAAATSLPSDEVTLAETLVHELQHMKLCAIADQVPLVREGHQNLYYAPWRDDPRPLTGLLQGAYAYLGVTRFWDIQRWLLDPERAVHGHVEYARRRREALEVTQILLGSGGLTPAGIRFVSRMRSRLLNGRAAAVPGYAKLMADEISMDHKMTWRMHHIVPDPELVSDLLKSWRAGRSPGRDTSAARTDRVRAQYFPTGARAMLLTLRHTDPGRFRDWLQSETMASLSRSTREPAVSAWGPPVSNGDIALLEGDNAGAMRNYCAEIQISPGQPEPWAGLVLAAGKLMGYEENTLTQDLPVICALHAAIYDATGAAPDPLDLANWLTSEHIARPDNS